VSWPSLAVAPHPELYLRTVGAICPRPLGSLATPGTIGALLLAGAPVPIPPPDDALRAVIRDLLRHGGFKPTGRSKPSSEYLARTAAEGLLPSINPLVDVGNAVSLHSGIPISVVDLDRARPPLTVAIAPSGASFVFNASGQSIDVGGLVGLADAEGPCANAVKDAQRTKTGTATTRALFLFWGHRKVTWRADAAAEWCRALLEEAGIPARLDP